MTASDPPRLRLVQYWHDGSPPPEVAALMQGWACDPCYDHTAFDHAAAVVFLRAHFRGRVIRAFQACGVPAMQADFFRYCALFAQGGIYLDADIENLGGLPALLADSGRGVLVNRRGRIANDIMYVAEPQDPLFGAVIGQAIANIERQASQSVWKVTGPGIMTALQQDPRQAALFDGFRIVPVQDAALVVRFVWDMDYKQGETDWRRVGEGGEGSIFS